MDELTPQDNPEEPETGGPNPSSGEAGHQAWSPPPVAGDWGASQDSEPADPQKSPGSEGMAGWRDPTDWAAAGSACREAR